ncbi:MAG: complex I NDUFA9 subunit family protein [Pseudomonadota bacterium]
MSDLVTIFGGSGFIGQYATRALIKAGFRVRIAVRTPDNAQSLADSDGSGSIEIVKADVRDFASVTRAIEGAAAVVNLVGILYEQGGQSFAAAQRDGAVNVAKAAAAAGISRFVQMSAIGANEGAKAAYADTKGEAERLVREVVPEAVVLRPSIVFGPEDDFFNRFAELASSPVSHIAPFLPAIGGGETLLQPVYVGDVAQAIVAGLTRDDIAGKTYELGGPERYSFKALYRFISDTIKRKRYPLTLPFFVAKPMGMMMSGVWNVPFLPMWTVFGPPPITGDQVEMLKRDNVVSDGALTLADLGLNEPASIEAIVPDYLAKYQPKA